MWNKTPIYEKKKLFQRHTYKYIIIFIDCFVRKYELLIQKVLGNTKIDWSNIRKHVQLNPALYHFVDYLTHMFPLSRSYIFYDWPQFVANFDDGVVLLADGGLLLIQLHVLELLHLHKELRWNLESIYLLIFAMLYCFQGCLLWIWSLCLLLPRYINIISSLHSKYNT